MYLVYFYSQKQMQNVLVQYNNTKNYLSCHHPVDGDDFLSGYWHEYLYVNNKQIADTVEV